MKVEEEYEDVLQNLEGAIIMYYREKPELIDGEVERAIDWLIRIYGAEVQGKKSGQTAPRGISGEVAEVVKQICEWRLGREEIEVEEEQGEVKGSLEENLEPIVLVECLKRIKSSIKFWTQKGGRQGYLDYVDEFFP